MTNRQVKDPASPKSPAPRGRGRPRDPKVEQKIRSSAISLFADVGWAGFSMEGVAKLAGVGKGSVYLRWPTAAELLVDSLRSELRFVDDTDTGSLRGDLLALARQIAKVYEGDRGQAYFRTLLEGEAIPGFELYRDFQQSEMAISRAIVRRAVERGELTIETKVTMVLDVLSGGLLVHAITTPTHLRSAAKSAHYPEEIVDFVLRAASVK